MKSPYEEIHTSSSSPYPFIRSLIESKNLNAAEESLNSTSQSDAEWNFLMGVINMRKGWYDNAHTYLTNACTQDPFNKEYKVIFDELNDSNNSYRVSYNNRDDGKDSKWDTCFNCESGLCCIEGMCECCGEGSFDGCTIC